MKQRQSLDFISRYLTVVMGFAYLGGGIFLIASSQSFGMLPTGRFRSWLAALLIIYGIFRILRGVQQFRQWRKE